MWLSSNWQEDMGHMDREVPIGHNSEGFAIKETITNTSLIEEFSFHSNVTLEYCQRVFANETKLLMELYSDRFCPTMSDLIMCWPPTALNQTAVIKCFSELFGVIYDDTQNATRHCMENGTWAKSNYDKCMEILPFIPDVETQTTIYFIGYTLSLVTLSIAIGIFTYFKELRCLRNTIHMNLMWSYILTYTTWIITLLVLHIGGDMTISCIFVVTLLHYFHITTFFWMFVEGLYLYILVVETLSRENFKLRVYIVIGWGIPFIFILSWAIVKCFLPVAADSENTCYWFESHAIDWIFQTPTMVVLLLNLLFLIAIMWVLITKLRSANTLEHQQYHKAAKALLVLMPLLGITYIITIYAPAIYFFEFARAFLLSTQGFTVALFYCFLNTEVQNAVKHHWDNWKTRRSLSNNRHRSSSRSKDWSPRSRTESIRLYSQPANFYRKRESCASEVTTTTMVTVNGGSIRQSSNEGLQSRSPFLHPPRLNYGHV